MFLNCFGVQINEGVEKDGYVEVPHGTQYTLTLINQKAQRCDATVVIDGKQQGTYRLNGNSQVRLERSAFDSGRFTFYQAGTSEATSSELDKVSRDNLGLVQVTFVAEKQWTLPPVRPNFIYEPTKRVITYRTTRTGGGTGLSGSSNQGFTSAGGMTYDESTRTTISLRLISSSAVQPQTPRPLQSHTNSVPPPV
jgi:hypothetical protein